MTVGSYWTPFKVVNQPENCSVWEWGSCSAPAWIWMTPTRLAQVE